MKFMKVGRLEFAYGGETLDICRHGQKLCTVPLAEILVFARQWNNEQERLAREKGHLHIAPSIMGTKVADYQTGGPLSWD